MENIFLSVKNLSIRYGETDILNEFNLSIEEGNIYCLVGPSGCGKSTLLKAICGIVKPVNGEILMKGRPVCPATQSIGYIPQQFGLLDWLTVKSNLFISKKIRKTSSFPEDNHIIEQLEISPLLNRYPKELSGGQQQRVALARAWLLRPKLLLMDEPFSSLDTFTAERSIELFLQLWRERRTTTLFVTHSLREAVQIGKYIVLLSRQPANVLEVLENPLFSHRSNRTEQDFYLVEQQIYNHLQELWEK
ncbi:MAG: ABC transporter ATP-binding protein [Dysgonamonadaceae bacterium]|jgi:NitT/TauT family transport system ATP-binding protein|nr:ABC transporter ATP-binding protein [Dysgonamonadaceae bacterium]